MWDSDHQIPVVFATFLLGPLTVAAAGTPANFGGIGDAGESRAMFMWTLFIFEASLIHFSFQNEHPTLGVAKLHVLLLSEHPEWTVNEKRLRHA